MLCKGESRLINWISPRYSHYVTLYGNGEGSNGNGRGKNPFRPPFSIDFLWISMTEREWQGHFPELQREMQESRGEMQESQGYDSERHR